MQWVRSGTAAAEARPNCLGSCYRRSLELAGEAHCKSIAFPAISCGVYRFPADDAVRIALDAVLETSPRVPSIERVLFACFDDAMFARYQTQLAALAARRQAPPSKPA